MTGRILDAGPMSKTDRQFLRQAFEQAKLGYDDGGCPIGSVLALGDQLIASGRNRRVQQGDPIADGEMDCLRNAGRQKSYRGMTLYTTLSPCMMCAGRSFSSQSPGWWPAKLKTSPAISTFWPIAALR